MATKKLGPGYYAINLNGVTFDADDQKRIKDAFKRALSVPSGQLEKPSEVRPFPVYEAVTLKNERKET